MSPGREPVSTIGPAWMLVINCAVVKNSLKRKLARGFFLPVLMVGFFPRRWRLSIPRFRTSEHKMVGHRPLRHLYGGKVETKLLLNNPLLR